MNKLYYGDNLDVLREHIADESVDLIYIDPPFNSKRNYNMIWDEATAQTEAFKDTWSLRSIADEEALIFEREPQRYSTLHRVIESLKNLLLGHDNSLYAYLVNIGLRLVELHRVLKSDGSFYLHCDPTASHYLKILLDAVFGKSNYRNEISWVRSQTKGHTTKNLPNCRDIIFRYSKTDNFHFKPPRGYYDDEYVDKFYKFKEKDGRRYQLGDLTNPNKDRPNLRYEFLGVTRVWRWTQERMEEAHKDGLIVQRKPGSVPRIKRYLDDMEGPNVTNDWDDVEHLHGSDSEYLQFDTQKPPKLLQRIIEMSCPEGGLVLDAYCGCGTTVVEVERLGRPWIGIDITYLAVDLIKQRLIDTFYLEKAGNDFPTAQRLFREDVEVFGIPRDVEGARTLARKTEGDRVRKEFEKWAIFTFGGIFIEKKGADTGIDGYVYLYDLDDKKKMKRLKAPIQVKSGNVEVSQIRDFSHVVDRERAPIGIFITLESPKKSMYDEVKGMPRYRNKVTGKEYDKIYILTVEDLINGDVPNLPITRATKQANANKTRVETEDLLE
jgi:site-specific DNA-methyltransferase (adenine-specific)